MRANRFMAALTGAIALAAGVAAGAGVLLRGDDATVIVISPAARPTRWRLKASTPSTRSV